MSADPEWGTADLPPPDTAGRLSLAVQSLLSPLPGGRTENQDNFLLVDAGGRAYFLRDQRPVVQQLPDWPAGQLRLAVLDGMGGHGNGREAAQRAVEGLLEIPAQGSQAELDRDLDALHLRLHRQMVRDGVEPGTTLTLVELPPSGPALLFHAGDSRLYRIDGQRARFLTVDQDPALQAAIHGLLDETAWYQTVHVKPGCILSQAFVLGSLLSAGSPDDILKAELMAIDDGLLPPYLRGLGDRRALDLEPGCTYLLSTDGLWALDQPAEFVGRWPELLGRGDRPVAESLAALFSEFLLLAQRDNWASGDNTTAIAWRMAER